MALVLWARVAKQWPQNLPARTQLGQAAFRKGDFVVARQHFEVAASAPGAQPRGWIQLALCCQKLGDDGGEAHALQQCLEADPYDLLGLLLRGQFNERMGHEHKAAASFGAAVAVAPPLEQLAPDLRPMVMHAMQFQEKYQARLGVFLDGYLAQQAQSSGLQASSRFKDSVDILLGRKRRYDSQPMRYFVPQVPAVEFFDRHHFPWLAAVEEATVAIRDEFLAILRNEHQGDFTPYIEYSPDQPLAQWAELNHNPNWSAFHLVKDGLPVSENAARCPKTMTAWARTPYPEQVGRTPVLLFSLLKPRTHIPSHVGASNCRLLVHLPLIIPKGCRFRVGSQTREWVPGQAWVFDDTIEHEAWNDSHELRVIMIFDTWNPFLSAEERIMITALNRGLSAFTDGSAQGYES